MLPPVVTPPAAVDAAALVSQARAGMVSSVNGATGTVIVAVPTPASTTPAAEQVTAEAGLSSAYARADHMHPRITRAGTTPTDSSGQVTASWASPVTSTSYIPVFTLPYVSGQQTTCHPVSGSQTTTGFKAQCVTSFALTLNAALVALGTKLIGPAPAAAGISVGWIVIPPSQ